MNRLAKNNWEGLELNGKRIEIVEEYKYLGEVINNKRTDKTTIEKRVQAANGVKAEIMAVVKTEEFRTRQIEVMLKLIQPCFESKLLYNSETWFNMSDVGYKKLEMSQNKIYIKALGLPQSTTNSAIILEFGLTKIKLFKIMKNKLVEYQRIKNMDEERMVKKVTQEAEKLGKRIYLQKQK